MLFNVYSRVNLVNQTSSKGKTSKYFLPNFGEQWSMVVICPNNPVQHMSPVDEIASRYIATLSLLMVIVNMETRSYFQFITVDVSSVHDSQVECGYKPMDEFET